MATHNDLGRKGEEIAARYLQENGYELLDANWCYGKAEIDLIAYIDGQIIFVEVKTRTTTAFGFPEEFVTLSKQKLLQSAAEAYIDVMNHEGEVRFDIISVIFNKQQFNINHIKDAFWPIST
ncbi:MAG: YraN family protein [Pedobacter sp.]|nr:YraN family protein [Pedobacter sp.]MDQ8053064.1 YraN family protein [Pedobacter sp.]